MKELIRRYGLPVALCYAAVLAALALWPGASMPTALCSFTVAGLAAACALAACRWRSRAGAYLLLAALTVLVCGVILNVNYYTVGSGGSLTHPVLQNTDADRAWWCAVALINEDVVLGTFTGYPTYVAIMLFGRDIFVAIMVDVLCCLLTLVASGELAWRLTRCRRTAFGTMLALSLMCYFMVQATLLIKDVPLALGVALLALGLVRLRQRAAATGATWALIGASVVIAAVYRPNLLFFYIPGAVIVGAGRRLDLRFAAVIALCLAAWALMEALLQKNPDPVQLAMGSPKYDFAQVKTMVWDRMTGEYSTFPVWKKLLLLPASVVLQFLIPFPWNYARDMVFGPTLAVAHFGYTWYLAGGLFLYWLAVLSRRSPALMVRLALWAVLLYVATAYAFSGRISRYCLPYLPLIMPAVAYTAVTSWRDRRLRVWMGVFAALMGVALVVCHHLHTSPL